MRETTDTALLTAAQGGDTAAYGELFDRYQQRIYSYAYGLAANAEDASDIAQDAFVRVFEMLPRKDAAELNFSAYLYRTTHNLAMDAIKARGKLADPEMLEFQTDPSLGADPEKVALLREQQEQTWRATFQLSDKHRSVLALRELGDMSYADIAETLEMPRNTVGVLLSRARLQFKEAFRMSSVDAKDIAKECEDMLGLLSGYIDKELTAEETSRIETHLSECAFCTLALEEMTEASASYRGLLPLLPPAGIAAGVMARVEEAAAAEGFGETAIGDAAEGEPGTDSAPDADAAGNGNGLAGHDMAAAAIEGAAKSGGGKVNRGVVVALVVSLVAMVILGLWGAGLLGGGDSSADSELDLPAAEATSTPVSSTDSSIVAPGTVVSPLDDNAVSANGSEAVVPTDTTPPPAPMQIYPGIEEVLEVAEMEFRWSSVEDATGVSYTLEIETYSLDQKAYVAYRTFTNLPETTFYHEMPTYLERWRIWAVDGAGNASEATGWRVFSRKLLATTVPPSLDVESAPETPTID